MNYYKLNQENLPHIKENVQIPTYDRSQVKTGIVHVGIGGFHRAHQAMYVDDLLQETSNNNEWGICGVALLDFDKKIYNTLKNQDGLYTLVIKQLDGTFTKRVIGSIVETLFAPESPSKVIEKMAHPDVKIITLTITEGGYNYNEEIQNFDFENPQVKFDLKNPNSPKTIFGYLTQAIKLRKERNLKGITIQSCDNIQGNGYMIKKMLLSYISKAEPQLIDWIGNNVTFPNSMVDRITPATLPQDLLDLKETTGIIDEWPVVCEPFKQWIIEDDFIFGRPTWETVGVQFAKNVTPYEKMKLSLLNAGHSVLGILGALIGYNTIDEAANDNDLSVFLKSYMDNEVSSVLDNLEGVDLEKYKLSLIERFKNINIKDQIDRICSESSAKIPIFILPTVNTQLKKSGQIKQATFVLAAWAIYCLGFNEKGEDINIKDILKKTIQFVAIDARKNPALFLEIETVFGKLKENKKFTSEFIDSYRSIETYGVKKCIAKLNQEI